MEKFIDGYDGHMDKECIEVCNALNSLPGVETTESCCGHLNDCYRIFLKTTNPYSLGVIGRVFDRRYSATHLTYRVSIVTNDGGELPMYTYMIESEKPYDTQEYMEEDVASIVKNINYWSQNEYKNYFGDDDHNFYVADTNDKRYSVKYSEESLEDKVKKIMSDNLAERSTLPPKENLTAMTDKEKLEAVRDKIVSRMDLLQYKPQCIEGYKELKRLLEFIDKEMGSA